MLLIWIPISPVTAFGESDKEGAGKEVWTPLQFFTWGICSLPDFPRLRSRSASYAPSRLPTRYVLQPSQSLLREALLLQRRTGNGGKANWYTNIQLHAQVYFQEAVTILLKPNNLKEAFKRQKDIGTNENRQIKT